MKGKSFKEKAELFQKEVIKKQLDIYNLTWDEFRELQKTNPNWENEYVLTDEQYKELEKYSIDLMRKIFKWNKRVCQLEWSWFSLNNTLPVEYENINSN